MTVTTGNGGCQTITPLRGPTPATGSTTPVPALQTHTPKVFVTPSTNLTNGERVEVAVTGFGKGSKFFLSECASPADANPLGCGPQLAAQPFGNTDTSGAGSYGFTVASTAPTSPYNTSSTLPCSDQCVIVATLGGHYAYSSISIAFSNG